MTEATHVPSKRHPLWQTGELHVCSGALEVPGRHQYQEEMSNNDKVKNVFVVLEDRPILEKKNNNL